LGGLFEGVFEFSLYLGGPPPLKPPFFWKPRGVASIHEKKRENLFKKVFLFCPPRLNRGPPPPKKRAWGGGVGPPHGILPAFLVP